MTGQRIQLGIAAIWGFFGVILLAAGSHGPYTGLMANAGQMLLFHAAGALALINTSLLSGWRRAAPVALWLAGSGLFALAIALHVVSGVAAFAMLTPFGGGLAILGWLVLVIGAFVPSKS